ncbi:MAG: MFS transporter [Nanoarchaeota archaeon]|nr:MFS transporter [Nanoarchaeota archaeon]
MVNHHQFWWRFFPKKELTQIYFSVALRSFAISLISIFIPLYLFQEKGLSFEQTLLFFIFYSVIFAGTMPLAAKFASRFGIKHSIMVAVPLYISFVALMYSSSSAVMQLLLTSSTLGASQAFYWMGMHLAFFHASHRKHRGEEVGIRSGVTVLSAMLGPFIGGLLITFAGFKAVFGLTTFILSASAVVLLLSKDGHVPYHFSMRAVFDKKYWKDSLFFVSRGSHVIVQGVIWPLFIFFILKSYFTMGIVGSLMSLSSAVLFWGVGRYSDHSDKRKIMRWGSIAESGTWVLMGLVKTVPQVFAVTVLSSLVNAVRESPTGALEYDKAKGQIAAYFVNREVFICLGRILALSVVLATSNLAHGLFFQAFANFAAFLF